MLFEIRKFVIHKAFKVFYEISIIYFCWHLIPLKNNNSNKILIFATQIYTCQKTINLIRFASAFPNSFNSPSKQLLRWRSVAHVQATGHRYATNRFLMPGAIPRNMKMAGLLEWNERKWHLMASNGSKKNVATQDRTGDLPTDNNNQLRQDQMAPPSGFWQIRRHCRAAAAPAQWCRNWGGQGGHGPPNIWQIS